MKIKLIPVWLVIVLLGWSSAGYAQSLFSTVDRDQPIDITSQQLEVHQDRRQSIFTGDVIVVQGGMTLRTERLTVYTDEQDQIRRIEADGNVRIVDPLRVATGNRAIYEQQDETLRLLGQAEVVQGENRIAGDEIILFVEENRSIVKSNEGGRVRARILQEKAPGTP